MRNKKLIRAIAAIACILYSSAAFFLEGILPPVGTSLKIPIMCVFSLPFSVFYIIASNKLEKSREKIILFLFTFVISPVFWGIVAAAAYIANSYFGANLFYSGFFYILGSGSAFIGALILTVSALTLTIYKLTGRYL